MTKELPSIEELRKKFHADFSTGKLYRFLADRTLKEVSGSVTKDRYLKLSCMGRTALMHRLIFALYHGHWPNGQIDHINGNRSDNRICNLRDVPHHENARNVKLTRNSKSGCMGVRWRKASRKWLAEIGSPRTGSYEYLGYFDNLDDAIAARKDAEVRHGYHPNHGERR